MPRIIVAETMALTGCSRGLLNPGEHNVPDDVADAAIALGAMLVEDKPKKKTRKRTATDKAAETAEKAIDE